MDKTFVDLYLEDPNINIDDYIDQWHDEDNSDMDLHEYLGFTNAEWTAFINTKDINKALEMARQRKIKFKQLDKSAKSFQKIKEAKQAIKKAQEFYKNK